MNNKSIEERIAEGVRKGMEEAKINERKAKAMNSASGFIFVAIVVGCVFVSLIPTSFMVHYLGWNIHIVMPILAFTTIGFSLLLYFKWVHFCFILGLYFFQHMVYHIFFHTNMGTLAMNNKTIEERIAEGVRKGIEQSYYYEI